MLEILAEEFEVPQQSASAPEYRPKYTPVQDERRPPSIFVKFWLLVTLVLLMVPGGLMWYAYVLSPIRELPDYRWTTNYRESHPTIAVEAPATDAGHFWIGSRHGGILRFDRATHMWHQALTRESTRGSLLSDDVNYLQLASGGRHSWVTFVCEENLRRGLTFADWSRSHENPKFWQFPFLDFSHLGIDTGNTLTSVAQGFRPDELIIGSSRSGVGIYHLPTRRWVSHITAESGEIADNRVHDLYRWSNRILVAHEVGIDICCEKDGKWTKLATISGLASKGVHRIYPRVEKPNEIELWCVTVGQGLVALTIGSEGSLIEKKVLVSERNVPGLTAELCRMADYHPKADLLWVGFQQGDGLGLARYFFSTHDWVGTAGPLPTRDIRCLFAEEKGSALLGTGQGLWQVWDSGGTSLPVSFRGLKSEDVREIAANSSWVWARSQLQPMAGSVPRRIRLTHNRPPSQDELWVWQDLIGPRRFPELTEDELTAASRIPGTSDYYFGTRSKGIGQWHGTSHEPSQAFNPADNGCPTGVVDLASLSSRHVVAVTIAGEIAQYDGSDWRMLFTPTAFAGRVKDIVTAAAAGSSLVVATSSGLAIYDMSTQRWKELPAIEKIVQLHCTKSELWARTDENKLYVFPTSELSTGRWKHVADNVIALRGTEELLVAVIQPPHSPAHLFLAQAGHLSLQPLFIPQPISDAPPTWDACCAFGADLYVAFTDQRLARYSLSTHSWEEIDWPPLSARPRKLEVTESGLWVLSEDGELWLWNRNRRFWIEPAIASHVESIAADAHGLLVLRRLPEELNDRARLLRIVDQENQLVLIGAPLSGGISSVSAAQEFSESLFLGGPEGIHRFRQRDHDWKSFRLEPGQTCVAFAPTGSFLYSLATQPGKEAGEVWVYRLREDDFLPVKDPENPQKTLQAQRLAGDGKRWMAFFAQGRGIRGISDDESPSARLFLASSDSGLRDRKVSAAAERDQDLFLGTEQGTLHIYARQQSGPPVWQFVSLPLTETGTRTPEGHKVRKILSLSSSDLVVVLNKEVQLLNSREGQWRFVRRLVSEAERCDAWEAGDGRILAAVTTRPTDAQAGCYSEVFEEAISSTSERKPLLGPPMQSSSSTSGTIAVAEWVTPEDLWIFRAAADGQLWQYSLLRRGWWKQSPEQVEIFHEGAGTLWAYAPERMTLYRLAGSESPSWQVLGHPQQTADFVGDATSVLVRTSSGQIELISVVGGSQVSRSILLAPPPPEFRGQQFRVAALAEIEDSLFCSFEDAGTFSYDLSQHRWQQKLNRVRRFVRRGGPSPELFALTKDGSLHRWRDATGSFEQVQTPAGVQDVTTVDESLVILTSEGGLLASEADGQWYPLLDPTGRLRVPAWSPIGAATEWHNMLILALEEGDRTRVVTFDSGTLAWRATEAVNGRPERFVLAGDRLLLIALTPSQARALYEVDIPNQKLVPLGGPLRALNGNHNELWALRADGAVLRLRAHEPTFNVESANLQLDLPVSAQVGISCAAAIERHLMVALSDGSVWHRTEGILGWRKLLEPAGVPRFRRQLVRIGNLLVTSEPDGTLLAFDPQTNGYRPLKSTEALSFPKQPEALWEIDPQGTKVRVRRSGSATWADLTSGKLPEDDFVDISVNTEYIFLLTAAGTIRVFERNGWREVALPQGQMPQAIFARPSPFEHKGTCFVTAENPQGSWLTNRPGIKLEIRCQPSEKRPLSGPLYAYSRSGQSGVGWQWASGILSIESHLLVSTPAGAIIFARSAGRLVPASYHQGPTSAGEGPALDPGPPATISWPGGPRLVWDSISASLRPATSDEQQLSPPPQPLADLLRNSVLGPRWAIEDAAQTLTLSMMTASGERCPVHLDSQGFGFDLIGGMALTQTEIVFYTRDGTVRYDRATGVGIPQQIETGEAVPLQALEAQCRTIEAPPGAALALLGRMPKVAWVLQGGRWSQVAAAQLAPNRPRPLWEGKYCRWRSDAEIHLTIPGKNPSRELSKTITTGLDLSCGRLHVDQWTAIVAYHGGIWAITRAGVIRINPAGYAEISLPQDSPYNWQAGGTFELLTEDSKTTWLVMALQRADSQKQELLVWDQSRWRPLSEDEPLYKLYEQRSELLLQGGQWRVRRSQINGVPIRTLERHWPWQESGRFLSVSIDPRHPRYPDVFDYERVNDVTFFQGQLWVASDAGVLRVSVPGAVIVDVSPSPSGDPVERICVRDGKLFIQANGIFQWDQAAGKWIPTNGEDPFAEQHTLWESRRWKVTAQPETEIWHRLAGGDQTLTRVAIVQDPQGGFRFDFDVVTTCQGEKDSVFLLSKRGVIERRFSQPDELLPVPLTGGRVTDESTKLFSVGPKETERLVIEHQGVFYTRESAGKLWRQVDEGTRKWIIATHRRYETWSLSWFVESRQVGGKVKVRFADDRAYKSTDFLAPAGLFDFDLVNDLAVLPAGPGGHLVMLATQGGIVDVAPKEGWRRRYASLEEDGIPHARVTGLAGSTRARLVAKVALAGPEPTAKYYEFQAPEARWVLLPSSPPAEDVYRRLRCMLFNNPSGWTAADLAAYRLLGGHVPSTYEAPLTITWGNQPVWLVDTTDGVAFAHDVRHSVESHDGSLWVATDGGIVRWFFPPESSQQRPSSSDLEIFAADFIERWDFFAPASPPALGLIKYVEPAKALVTLGIKGVPSGEKAGEYDPFRGFRWDPNQKAFRRTTPDEARHAQTIVDDGFWFWRKDGLRQVTVGFHAGRAEIPRNYTFIQDGTFRFYDPTPPSPAFPRLRSILSIQGQLFVATAGGIMVFNGGDSYPAKLYAMGDTPDGGRKLSLERPLGMFYHVVTGRVFVVCNDDQNPGSAPLLFLFEPGHPHQKRPDRWVLFSGSDPFQDADLLVNNELLMWRQLTTEARVELKNTDLLPDTPYQLFHDGKFAFDYVVAIAPVGQTVWAATAGGAVEFGTTDRRIRRIFAQCFGIGPERQLPDVREVVASPLTPSDREKELYARTGSKEAFRFEVGPPGELGRWIPVSGEIAEQIFDAAYRKATLAPDFWSWVQPPDGIYVELQRTDPPKLRCGRSTPEAHVPLMSRGRFIWDDLREAVLVEDELLVATPAGICVYAIDLPAQKAQFQMLYGAIDTGHGNNIPMTGIERLVNEGTELAAWNDSHVFRGTRTSSGWQWELDSSRRPAEMSHTRRWVTSAGQWKLVADTDGRGLTVTFSPSFEGGKSHTVLHAPWIGVRGYEIARAVFYSQGVLVPGPKGVLWIDLEFAKRQRMWRYPALAATMGCSLLFLIVFAPAFGKKRKFAFHN